jgi:diacylglycerol kinase family enzyme
VPDRGEEVSTRGPRQPRRAAVIVNPTKLDDAQSLRAAVSDALAGAGWEGPLWLETSADDPGRGMAEQALSQGVGLVMVCGGDGTVRAVLTVLAGSGVPLAVLPAGTGNLLARNLGLPVDDLDAAIDIALGGMDRAIDVGRLEPTDPQGPHERFAVMAGVGLDAAIMRDAPEKVKARFGWPAYVLSALRNVRRPGVRMRLTIDGGRPVQTRAQTIVVGNLGKLPAGVELLPEAVPDDGVLDVAVIASRGLLDYARILGRVATRRGHVDHRFLTYRGKHIEVLLPSPQPRQVDGDLLDPSLSLVVEIEPAAIIVRVRPPN